MAVLIYDTESDGLLNEATKLHCLVTHNLETDETKVYHDSELQPCDGTIAEGVATLLWADVSVAHNALGHDIPLLEKLGYIESIWREKLTKKTHDSFILSQMLFSHEMKQHGLGAWGKRLGVEKPKHEDWSVLTEEMLHRCTEDVRINVKLYKMFLKVGIDVKTLQFEQELYIHYLKNQTGVRINVPRMDRLSGKLEFLIEICDKYIANNVGLRVSNEGTMTNIFKKDGDMTLNTLKWCIKVFICEKNIIGPFTRVSIEPVSISSTKQMSEALLKLGWVPDSYTPGEKPQIAGSQFSGIKGKLGKYLVKRSEYSHKRNQLRGILSKTVDGVCPTPALTAGCNTGRWKHRIVANIPK